MNDLAGKIELVKKMQKVIFGMLCDIDNFCRENHITYFLSGGTCLGAVRHHGFIPWDDDADLMMPREDYERFLRSFPHAFEKKYSLGSLVTDTKWQRPFSRICDMNSSIKPTRFTEEAMGIFVDLFPIDGLPRGKGKQHRHYEKLRILNALRNTSVRTEFREQEGFRIVKNLAGLFTRSIGPRYFAEKMDREASKFRYSDSDQVAAILAIHYWDKETIDRKHMESAAHMLFEGRLFPVPAGYDRYLSNLYGDYMTIPKDAAETGYTHLDGWVVEFSEENKQK